MRQSFRQTVIVTTAIIGLSTYAAVAAPPSSGDPTAVHPSVTATNGSSSQSTAASRASAAKIEQRIVDLHGELAISPAQQPQWNQFAQVMRGNAENMDEVFQRRMQAMPTMTATDNMASYAQVTKEHADNTQKLVPAFQALYDTMSDNQKMTADKVFRTDANHGDQTRHG
jgi:hypothetical protein